MESREIRRRFIEFFEPRGHKVVPSSSLIPNDPTLLLTNAGMNQFKPYFLGLQDPPSPRAASIQKVFRTSDIDNVGRTDRHLTFFEMLGNFSFGDYFKEGAVDLAWEFVTSKEEGFGLDPERIWVTVFETDDEAASLWRDRTGIPEARIVRRGKADNFWDMGVAGPCGPSSEIFFDRGPKHGPEGGPDVDEDRYLEIWNLVFMQNEQDDAGDIVGELPKKNIDTGMGLERAAIVMQDAPEMFQTDAFLPMLELAAELAGRPYGKVERDDISLRVIADHARATTFLISDGVLPSNEGRGYVLRRMLRRLVTRARKLGIDHPVMAELIGEVVGLMGHDYPDLVERKPFVLQVAASEEERFGATYRQGLALFEQEVERAKAAGKQTLSGDVAFKLHDTHGFPLELTLELAAEEELAVETDRFARLMDEQRSRAQKAAKKGDVAEGPLGEISAAFGPTEFLGYERLSSDGRVLALVTEEGRRETAGEGTGVRLVLDRTPFYPEGGGQVGDAGTIQTPSGLIRVTDTRPGPGGIIVHHGQVASGEVRQGDEVGAQVDTERREATARSHTATHVLHHTLRHFLGEHARQAGSLVAPGRVRFDFTHFEPVPKHALEEVEYLANRRLAEDGSVRAYETTMDFARSQGAIGLFGEKYGDIVRVVEIGDYSIELCGGTHVHHTGEVALLRLVSEASIGSGFRRIEALTGPDALKHVNVERRLLEEVVDALGASDPAQAPERARQALARLKQLESELGKIRKAEREGEVERLAAGASDVAGVALVVAQMEGQGADELRERALSLRNRLEPKGPGAAVLGSADGGGKAVLVAAVTNELVSRGVTAPALLEQAAKVIGGGAGGKPNLAFAGGSRSAALPDALGGVRDRLMALLAGS